jgi:hypothetical protein
MTETEALKKPFLVGLLAVAIVFVILGGLIAVFSSVDDRPEGVAERWLTAVGDTTRKGVQSDARKRVNAHGDASLAAGLIGTADYDGKSAFVQLEVGKARRTAGGAVVPFKVTDRVPSNAQPQRGLLVLSRDGDSWRVTALGPPDAGLKVPSDGGDVASKAPIGLYAMSLVVGVGVAVGASALVRAAGREQEFSLLHA